jgi:hypothetical protein
MSSDVNNLPLITRVKYVAIFFLIAPMIFSLFVFNSYTDEAMQAFLWGARGDCAPTAESKSIVYQKLRRVDKSPLYLSPQGDSHIIVSNKQLSVGGEYKCFLLEDVSFIYEGEGFFGFVSNYDRTYSSAGIFSFFIFIFLGLGFVFYYVFLFFSNKRKTG